MNAVISLMLYSFEKWHTLLAVVFLPSGRNNRLPKSLELETSKLTVYTE